MTIKEVYSQEYHKILNQILAKHPKFKEGMDVNFADFAYNMVFKTPNMESPHQTKFYPR